MWPLWKGCKLWDSNNYFLNVPNKGVTKQNKQGYPVSRGFSVAWLLAFMKSFACLGCCVVGLFTPCEKQINYADKLRKWLCKLQKPICKRETSAHRVQARYSDYMYISEVHCIHTVYSLKRHTLVKVVAMGLKQDYPLQSTLSKTDTFGTSTSCPSQRDVRLIERQIEGGKKGRDQH